MKSFRALLFVFILASSMLVFSSALAIAQASQPLAPEHHWTARPMHQAGSLASPYVGGYTPTQIRTAYNLPSSGGTGTTIAIIVAFNYSTARSDLTVFCNQFGLPQANLEIYNMSSRIRTDTEWASEAAMDVQWSHAIAPDAKILLVQALSDNDSDLLAAVDYARNRPDVVSISMSWGGPEDSTVTRLDYHFTSSYGAVFFAASGDSGSADVIWPAISPNVVAVGGTTLNLYTNGTVISETGWSGSGGGISAYESRPAYQSTFGLSGTRRTIPDVAYDANPATGVPVYTNSLWQVWGGTSAGAPQWAAIHALGRSSSHSSLYAAAKSSSYASYFRDITRGSNGGYTAGTSYDYVTGLGSPLTANFSTATTLPAPSSETGYITLLPAGQSRPLNATNQFAVTYTKGGATMTANAQNSTLTLTTDVNTIITVAGQSTGSTAQEKWVLNANSMPVTGKNMTLYYYDLLAEIASSVITGGGNPQNQTLTYGTAPATASSQQSLRSASIQLDQSTRTIWVAVGTTVSVASSISASPTERWTTQTSSWLVTAANQLPKITYYHEFLLNVTGAATFSRWFNSSGIAQVTMPGISDRESGNGVGQRVASYSIDVGAPVQVQPTADIVTISVLMNAAHQVKIVNMPQYQVALDSSAARELTSITQPAIAGDGYWYDEGTPVQVVLNGTANRSAGVGERLSAFTVNGVQTTVASLGQVNVLNVASLSSPQRLSATIIKQYQIALDAQAAKALTLITSPTISGDNYWYDEGSSVRLNLSYAPRSIGEGERLSAYSVNGAQTIVSSLGQVTALDITSLGSAQRVSATITKQYQLDTSSGSAKSLTAPSVNGDAGWYDEGTSVTATYNYVWNSSPDQSRLNAVNYTLSQGVPQVISRAGNGAFTVQLTMTKPEAITVGAVKQHPVVVSAGSNIVLSPPSPTGDSFYDEGTVLSVTTDRVWGMVDGDTKQVLVGYESNGVASNVTIAELGTFTTPQFTIDEAQRLTFNSITEYLVTFQFKNSNGEENIMPTAFQITSDGKVVDIPQFSLWLDEGARFQIQSIIWQNAEVKPADQANYTVNSPLTETIRCRIFNAQIVVQDHQGKPVSGAQVDVTLANQTGIQAITDENGTVNLPMIPLGTYNATITSNGLSAAFSSDASTEPVATRTLPPPPLPLTEILAVAATIIVSVSAGMVAYMLKSKKNQKQRSAPKI